MCGVGVAMGLQALGGYNSRRASLAQYQAQAQQYQNMANTAQSNANLMRFNEVQTGVAGGQEQSQIRQRGKSALANINVGASANNISGVSVDALSGYSAKQTADDLNTSRYNTNLKMYGQEVQAQNYEQQANVYNQYAQAYRDMSHENVFTSLLSTLPSVLQTYYNWNNVTKGSLPTNTGSTQESGSPKILTMEDGIGSKVTDNFLASYSGDFANPDFWTSDNTIQGIDISKPVTRTGVSLGVQVPVSQPQAVAPMPDDAYSGWSIYNYLKYPDTWSQIYKKARS